MNRDLAANYLLLTIAKQMSEILIWRDELVCVASWPFYTHAVQPRREGREFVGFVFQTVGIFQFPVVILFFTGTHGLLLAMALNLSAAYVKFCSSNRTCRFS